MQLLASGRDGCGTGGCGATGGGSPQLSSDSAMTDERSTRMTAVRGGGGLQHWPHRSPAAISRPRRATPLWRGTLCPEGVAMATEYVLLRYGDAARRGS